MSRYQDAEAFYARHARIYMVLLELTYRCNFACRHCLIEPFEGTGTDLSTDEVLRLMDEMAEAGVFQLILSGGEIFLRPDLLDLLRHARALRFMVQLKSNAALVSEEIAQEIRAIGGVRGIDVTVFSCDPDANDRMTGRTGSLERVMRGAYRLREAGLRVEIKLLPTRDAADKIPETYDWLVAEGFQVDVPFNLVGDDSALCGVWRLEATPAQKIEILEALEERTGFSYDVQENPLDLALCRAGLTLLEVTPYGDVRACGYMQSTFGNVRDSSFAGVLRSEARQRWLEHSRLSLKRCQSCRALPVCDFCPGVAERTTGDPFTRSALNCQQGLLTFRAAGGRRDGDRLVLPDPPGGLEA